MYIYMYSYLYVYINVYVSILFIRVRHFVPGTRQPPSLRVGANVVFEDPKFVSQVVSHRTYLSISLEGQLPHKIDNLFFAITD